MKDAFDTPIETGENSDIQTNYLIRKSFNRYFHCGVKGGGRIMPVDASSLGFSLIGGESQPSGKLRGGSPSQQNAS